jgi:hypothetical protein
MELQDFALRHFLAGFGEDFIDPLAPELDHLAHGFGIEIVTDEDADLISPDFTGSSPAPAEVRIVHDVVVEQGCRVDEFDETSELMVIPAGIAAQLGAEQQ